MRWSLEAAESDFTIVKVGNSCSGIRIEWRSTKVCPETLVDIGLPSIILKRTEFIGLQCHLEIIQPIQQDRHAALTAITDISHSNT